MTARITNFYHILLYIHCLVLVCTLLAFSTGFFFLAADHWIRYLSVAAVQFLPTSPTSISFFFFFFFLLNRNYNWFFISLDSHKALYVVPKTQEDLSVDIIFSASFWFVFLFIIKFYPLGLFLLRNKVHQA